jgi:transcriptional regulator with XRE-family HTH domain
MEVAKQFAANLSRARKQAGLSQDALGFAAGLHRTEISLLERGRRMPRIDTLVKLAASLRVSPESLLDGIVWNPARIASGGFGGGEAGPDSEDRGDAY